MGYARAGSSPALGTILPFLNFPEYSYKTILNLYKNQPSRVLDSYFFQNIQKYYFCLLYFLGVYLGVKIFTEVRGSQATLENRLHFRFAKVA